MNISVTSTADDGSHKQGQVAVVQLQRVEAGGELELGLHHVAKRPSEALEEFSGDEADETTATGHQKAVFVHTGGQEGEQGLVNPVFQESHLIGQVGRPEHHICTLYKVIYFCQCANTDLC